MRQTIKIPFKNYTRSKAPEANFTTNFLKSSNDGLGYIYIAQEPNSKRYKLRVTQNSKIAKSKNVIYFTAVTEYKELKKSVIDCFMNWDKINIQSGFKEDFTKDVISVLEGFIDNAYYETNTSKYVYFIPIFNTLDLKPMPALQAIYK